MTTLTAAALGCGVAGAGSAHTGGRYWTERQASAEALAFATVAADEADCDGTDRPRRRAGLVLFRHFFCFLVEVTDAPDEGTLSEPVERFELHVLGNGKAISRNHVRNWESTPGWIDDRPRLRLPSLRGRTYQQATRLLERRGFSDPLEDEPKTWRVPGADPNFPDVRPDNLVCDHKLTWGRGRLTLLLYLGYPRCVGPPYLPPRAPPAIGERFGAAALTVRRLGISVTGLFRGDYVPLRGREHWLVCAQDPRTGQRSWEIRLTVAPRC